MIEFMREGKCIGERQYVHVYVFVCIHMYTYTGVHTYIHACIHISGVHTYIHACIHTFVSERGPFKKKGDAPDHTKATTQKKHW
jgi:hypothetical protein